MRKLPALTLLCVCVCVCVCRWNEAEERRSYESVSRYLRDELSFFRIINRPVLLLAVVAVPVPLPPPVLPLPAERLDSGIVIEFNRKYVSVYPLRRVYTARSTLIESKPTKTTSSPRTRAIRRSRRIRETGHESVGVASPQPDAIYRINCRGE